MDLIVSNFYTVTFKYCIFKNKFIDTGNRLVVISGVGSGGRVKQVKGMKYMVKDGN